MNAELFTFVKLDERIEKIPDGPGEIRLFPKELMVWEMIGIVGTTMGLLPSLLIKFLTPAMWMASLAKLGLVIMVIGFLPGFLRHCWLLIKGIWRWRKDFNVDVDHAFEHHRDITQWLMQFPKEDLEDRMHFIRDTHTRIGNRLSLLSGSLEKLGFIPLLVAVITQIQEFNNLGSLPVWRIILAVFLIIMYVMTIAVNLIKLRGQLYEMLLTRAIYKIDAGP